MRKEKAGQRTGHDEHEHGFERFELISIAFAALAAAAVCFASGSRFDG